VFNDAYASGKNKVINKKFEGIDVEEIYKFVSQ
jgi:hypothetical protein